MRPLAAMTLAVLVFGACGGSDPPSDQDQVRGAVTDYAEAAGGQDPERVCELIVTARGRVPPERCADRVARGLGRVELDARVRAVRVRGDRARATLAGGEQLLLRRVDGRWRIVTPG